MNMLLSIWLQLTGGEQGCSRRRFALTMLMAYGLYYLVLPRFAHCCVCVETSGQLGAFPLFTSAVFILVMVLAALSLLLAFLPFSPLALLGNEHTFYDTYQMIQGKSVSVADLPAEMWLYWVGFILGALAMLLAGSVVFGAAWRRLKDAGRSPLYLLLGLTYLLGFDSGGYSVEAAGVYLLGPLWLIILFSQPSRKRAEFAIFRPVP